MKKVFSKLRYQFKSGLRHGFKNVIFSKFFFGFVASLSMIISSYDKADRVKDSLNARFHDQEDTFDFIIVGAGTAGCLLANRLSENHKVLLLEAGGEPHPLQRIPGLAFFMVNYKETDYSHRTVPQRRGCFACVNKRASLSQGRNLGGSSNINWQVFLRGSPRDYNNWAQITGDHSWSYQEMLPYFKRSENYQGDTPDRDAHGFEGELMIDPPAYTGMAKEFIRAGQELGYEHVDLNARYEEGFDTVYSPIEGGERRSSFQAFLEPVRDRDNLIIRKYSHASKILVRGFDSTAFGIEYKRHGMKKFAYATKELILSAGAVESAKLLLLSGIGPGTQLADLGIPVIADLPVGQNLQDHLSTFLGPFFVDPPRSFLIDRDISLRGFYEYKSDGHGPLSTSLFQAAAMISSHHLKHNGIWNWPDIQLLFSGMGAHKTFPKDLSHAFNLNAKLMKRYYDHAIGRDSFFIAVAVARPYGRGEVILEKKDAWAPASINPRYLENDYDMKIMVNGVKTALQLVENTTSFQTLRARFTNRKFPGCDHLGFRSDEYWECYIRHYSVSLNDAAGTCAMGNPHMGVRGVVNSRLEVIGVNHLRVIDASVMPKIVASPTQAAVIAIAEKGADLVIEAWKSREGMFSTMPVPSLTTLPPIPGGPQANNLDPSYGAPPEQYYGPPPEQSNNVSPNYGPPNNNGFMFNQNNNNNQQPTNNAPTFNNNNNNNENNHQELNFSPPPQFSPPPPLPPQTTPNNNNNGFTNSFTQASDIQPVSFGGLPSSTDLPPAPYDSPNQQYGAPSGGYPSTQMAPPPIVYGAPADFSTEGYNNGPPPVPPFGNPIFGNNQEFGNRPFGNNMNYNGQDPRNVNGDTVPEPSTGIPNLAQDPLPGDPDDENAPRESQRIPNTGLNYETTTPTYDAQASEQLSTTTVATGTSGTITTISTSSTGADNPITMSQEVSNVFQPVPNRLRNQQASRPKVNFISHDTKKRPGVQISNPHPDLYYNNLNPTNPSGLPSRVNLPHHPLGPVYFRNPEYTVRDPIAIKMGQSTTTTSTSQKPPTLMDEEEHDVANTIARFTTVKPSDSSLSDYYQKHKPQQRPNPIVRYTGLGVTNRVPSTANVADIYYRIMDTTSTDVTSFNNAPELVDFNDSASSDQTPANSNFFASINSSHVHQHNNNDNQQDGQGNQLENNDSLVSTSNSFWVNKDFVTPNYGFQTISTTKSPTTNPYWTNNSPQPENVNESDNSFDNLKQGSTQQTFIANHATGQTASQTFYKNSHGHSYTMTKMSNNDENSNNVNIHKVEVTSEPKIKRRPGKVVKIKSELSWTTRPTSSTTPKPYSVSKQTHVQTYGLAQSANDQMYLDKGVSSQTIVPSGRPFVKSEWPGPGDGDDNTQFSENNNINSGRKTKKVVNKGKPESDEVNEDENKEQQDDSITSHSINEAHTQHWPPKRGKPNKLLQNFVTHSPSNDYEYDQHASPTTHPPKTWVSTVAPNSNFAVNLELIPPKSEEGEDDDTISQSTLKSIANNIKKSTKGLWNAVTGVVWKGNPNGDEQESSTSNKVKKYSPSSTTSRPYNHVPSQDHTVLIKNAIEFGANPGSFKATPPEFFAQEKPGIFKRPPFHIDPNIPPPPSFPTISSETLNTQIPDDSYNPQGVRGIDYTTDHGQLDSNEIVPPLTPPPLVYPNELNDYRPMFPKPTSNQEQDSSTNTYDDNERIPGLNPPDFSEPENTDRPQQQQQNNHNYPDSAEVLSNFAANFNSNPITPNAPTPLNVEIKTHDMDLSTTPTPRPFLPRFNLKDPALDTGVFTSETFAVPLPPEGNEQDNVGQIPDFFSQTEKNNQESRFPTFNGNNKGGKDNERYPANTDTESNEFNYNDKDSRGSTEKYPEYPNGFEPYQNQGDFNQDGFTQNSNIQSPATAEQFPAFVSTVAPNIQLPLGSREDFANKLKTLGSSVNDILSQANSFPTRDKNGGLFETRPSSGNNFHKNIDPFDITQENFKGRPMENFNTEGGNSGFSLSPEQTRAPPAPGSHYDKNAQSGKPHFSDETTRPTNPSQTPVFGARIHHQRNKNIFNLPERLSNFGIKETNFGSNQNSFERNNPNQSTNPNGGGRNFGGNDGNDQNNFQENTSSGSFREIIKDAIKDNQNNFEQNPYPEFGSNEPNKFGQNNNGNNFGEEQIQNTNNFIDPNINAENYNSANTKDQFNSNQNTNFNFAAENPNFNDGNSQPVVDFEPNNNNFPADNFNPNFVQNSQVSYSNPTNFEENFESTTANNYNNEFSPETATPTAIRSEGSTKEYDITSDPDTVEITVENNKNIPNRFKSYDITSDPDTVDITEDDPDFPDRFNNIRRNFVQKQRRRRKNGRRRRLRIIRHPNMQNPDKENNGFTEPPIPTRNQQRRRNQMMRNNRRNRQPGGGPNENSVEINRRSSNLEGEIAYIDPPSQKAKPVQNPNNFVANPQNNTFSSNRNRNNRVSYNSTLLQTSESRPVATVVDVPNRYTEIYQNSKRKDPKTVVSANPHINSPTSRPVASITSARKEINPSTQSGYQFPIFNSNKQRHPQYTVTSPVTTSKNFIVSVGNPTTLKPVSVLQDVTPKRNIATITNVDIARKSKPTPRIEKNQQTFLSKANGTNSVEYDQQADDYYDKLQSFFSSFYDQSNLSKRGGAHQNTKNSTGSYQNAQNGFQQPASRKSDSSSGRSRKSDRNASASKGSSRRAQNGQSNSNAHFKAKGNNNANTNSRSSSLVRDNRVSNSSVHKRIGEGVAAKLTSTNTNKYVETHLPQASAVSYVNSQSRPKSKTTPQNNTRTKPRPESTVKNKASSSESLPTNRNFNSRPNLMEISHRNSRSKA